MNFNIGLILVQDGMVNGALFALLAMAIIIAFTVTRIIIFFQGELIAFAALTMAAFTAGQVPGSLMLLLIASAASIVNALIRNRRNITLPLLGRILAFDIAYPALVCLAVLQMAPLKPGLLVSCVLTVALIAPLGPIIYRIAFQPVKEASVLTLLMISMGCHLVVLAGGLFVFGSDGARGPRLISGNFSIGGMVVQWHSLVVVLTTLVLLVAFWIFFKHTLYGKALRASAVNRIGAQLMGIKTAHMGQVAFLMAGILGSISGILIAPIATIYYDSGFVIGLKGFVAAIIGGLTAYPLAVAASIAVGMIESFASFWASAFKEVVVFSLVIPILFWRSWRTVLLEDDEHE